MVSKFNTPEDGTEIILATPDDDDPVIDPETISKSTAKLKTESNTDFEIDLDTVPDPETYSANHSDLEKTQSSDFSTKPPSKRTVKSHSKSWWKKKRWLLPFIVLITGLILPNHWRIPVMGANSNDWHPKTFWYEPWGSSITHKGIDIFGPSNTQVVAANHGLLLYRGEFAKGGKVVVLLGPEWKIHYYAHLASFNTDRWFYQSGDPLGTLGATGNAKNKPPHLHFTVLSLLPYLWYADATTQGWKKMFYLDPNHYLIKN